MAARITGTKKDNSGEICEYILDTGETISKAEGVTKAKNGEIDGVIVAHSRKGEEYLRTKPDGSEGNNLLEKHKNCISYGALRFFINNIISKRNSIYI